ncbi:hypothetical protein QZH41_009989 [Actinostola sp. cb2023]|nr:hypothetical protein QZH41_009989 [Actinostola sp. cb2023]
MGPSVLVALQNTSFNIQKFMNDSKKPVDLIEIDRRFTKGMDLALALIFPAATLAWPGVKKVWGYIKKTVIGKKINQLEQAIGKKDKINCRSTNSGCEKNYCRQINEIRICPKTTKANC